MSSLVKTDLNCLFKALALSLGLAAIPLSVKGIVTGVRKIAEGICYLCKLELKWMRVRFKCNSPASIFNATKLCHNDIINNRDFH